MIEMVLKHKGNLKFACNGFKQRPVLAGELFSRVYNRLIDTWQVPTYISNEIRLGESKPSNKPFRFLLSPEITFEKEMRVTSNGCELWIFANWIGSNGVRHRPRLGAITVKKGTKNYINGLHKLYESFEKVAKQFVEKHIKSFSWQDYNIGIADDKDIVQYWSSEEDYAPTYNDLHQVSEEDKNNIADLDLDDGTEKLNRNSGIIIRA